MIRQAIPTISWLRIPEEIQVQEPSSTPQWGVVHEQALKHVPKVTGKFMGLFSLGLDLIGVTE